MHDGDERKRPDFAEVERRLRELADEITLSTKGREELEMYLRVNEFDLALETVAYGLAEREPHVSERHLSEINEIAGMMSLDGEHVLAEMRAVRDRRREER